MNPQGGFLSSDVFTKTTIEKNKNKYPLETSSTLKTRQHTLDGSALVCMYISINKANMRENKNIKKNTDFYIRKNSFFFKTRHPVFNQKNTSDLPRSFFLPPALVSASPSTIYCSCCLSTTNNIVDRLIAKHRYLHIHQRFIVFMTHRERGKGGHQVAGACRTPHPPQGRTRTPRILPL